MIEEQWSVAPRVEEPCPIGERFDELREALLESQMTSALIRADELLLTLKADIDSYMDRRFEDGVEAAAELVGAHCCVSSCCDAQPGGTTAKELAACVRKNVDRGR